MASPLPKAVSPVLRRLQPAATLERNGATWSLLFTFAALAEAENRTGLDLLAHHPAVYYRRAGAGTIRGMLYAALCARHSVTPDEAGALIGVTSMPAILEAISRAWVLSMPEPKAPPAKGGGGKELTGPEQWQSVYPAARIRLGLSDREFGEITPRLLRLLLDEEDREREERRTLFGIVAAANANFSAARPEGRVFHPSDFVGGTQEARKEASAPRRFRNEKIRAFLMARTTETVKRPM